MTSAPMWMKIAMVGLGGFVGATLRFGLCEWSQRTLSPGFPWGVFAANMLGCLFIGLLFGLAEARELFSLEARLFLFVGVLGSFTTFSTFGWDVYQLLRDGRFALAAANAGGQAVLGVTLVYAAHTLATRLFAS